MVYFLGLILILEKEKLILSLNYPFSPNQKYTEINFENIEKSEVYDKEVGKIALSLKILTKETELMNFG